MDELSNLTINFCGKERHFKRCPTSRLTTYTRKIEDLQMELQNKGVNAREMEIEAENLEAQAQATDDKDLKFSLLEQARDLRKNSKNIRENMIKESRADETKMQERYAELCCQLLEPLSVEEFMQNFDSKDLALVQSIGILYDMYFSGVPEIKIKNKINQIIEANADARINRLFQAPG
jgi:hypothetical protein